MKRSELKRGAPMKRGTSTLARTPFKASTPKPRKTTPPKVRDTPRPKIIPDALAQRHIARVVELGCIACWNMGYRGTPAEFHHCRTFAGGGQKATDYHGIGLCPQHHRLGGSGVAYHAGPQTWERIHGTEAALLLQVLTMLGFAIFPEQLARRDLGALLYPQYVKP